MAADKPCPLLQPSLIWKCWKNLSQMSLCGAALKAVRQFLTTSFSNKFSLFQALNTFIDDIFAFVIKMPTMYRLGCFRDDIVFFIFLYQKYVYRVSCFLVFCFEKCSDQM